MRKSDKAGSMVIVCPVCRKTPQTVKGDQVWTTSCPSCGGICALGDTAEKSIHCWNACQMQEGS